MKDNTSLFKPYTPFDGPVSKQTRPGRRVVHGGLGHRRKRWAGTVTGKDVMGSAGPYSSSLNLGHSLPSPAEMNRQEEKEEFLRGLDKSKLPMPTDKRNGPTR
jgi:hypothetical protein